jgi:hypothetical protein
VPIEIWWRETETYAIMMNSGLASGLRCKEEWEKYPIPTPQIRTQNTPS